MKKLLSLWLALAFTASLRAAIPPAENLLPSDTLLVLTIPDFAALKSAAHESPQWQLWNDPAMKPFHDKFVSKFKESFVAPLEQDLGVKLADFAKLPQGQLTVAVTQNGWTGGDETRQPGILLLLDAGSQSDLLKTNLAALEKKWRDNGKTIHTETVRGIPFSVVPLSSNDVPDVLSGLLPHRQPVQELGKEPKPEKPHQLVVGQFESLLIAGSSIETVEPVVAHLSGGGVPALADNEQFAADKLAQLRDSPLYYGWFNAKTVFESLARMLAPSPDDPAERRFPSPPWDKIIAAAGLTGVKSVCFAYRETHDGALVNFYAAAPRSGRKGLTKIFSAVHESAVPPSFVPADTVKFSRWRLDGQDGWEALQNMIGEISPAALSGLNAAISMANANAQQKDPSFDIRKNLIGNLGDDFISYQKAPRGKTLQDLNGPPSLFLVGVNSGDQAAAAINSLAGLVVKGRQKAPEPREFQGHKIYTIPLPGVRQAAGANDPASRALYCAAGGGYVALTTDVSMIEEYLRSAGKPPKPLSGTPGLIDAAQHVGGAGSGIFGYDNQRETMRTVFAALKNDAASGPAGLSPMAVLPKSIRGWMDFSLLPDYDSVSKYFSFSVYSGSTTADGFTFKAFTPRPPGLN
jgi:hypothetical protein